MELKISCDATVKLKKITSLKTIDCNVVDFEIAKDTLNGNIKIDGTYIKDNMDEEFSFSEIVPFTVVFRDSNFKVEEIVCANFSCQEIVNQGIECHFDVFITYEKDKKKKGEKEDVIEIPVEIETGENVIPVNEELAPNNEELALNNEELALNNEELEDILPVEDDEEDNPLIKEISKDAQLVSDDDISEEYDNMLKEILDTRNDNFLEQEVVRNSDEKKKEKVEVKVKAHDRVEKNHMFKNMKDNYSSLKVYFVENDVEAEKVCKNENISINDVYQDFAKNRRIIIK